MANWKTICSVYQTPQSKHDYMVGKRRWQIEGWFKTASIVLVYTVLARVLSWVFIVG